jgi:hypothetical protein
MNIEASEEAIWTTADNVVPGDVLIDGRKVIATRLIENRFVAIECAYGVLRPTLKERIALSTAAMD